MEKMQSELDIAINKFETLKKQLDAKDKLLNEHFASFPLGTDEAHDEQADKLQIDKDSTYHLLREAQQELWRLQGETK